MADFEVRTKPDGTQETVFTGKRFVPRPGQAGADPQSAAVRSNPILSIGYSLGSAFNEGFQTYQRTGDPRKAYMQGLQRLADDSQRDGLGRGIIRVAGGAVRDTAQSYPDIVRMVRNKDITLSAGSANFPGLNQPLPRINAKNPVEGFAQGALQWIPAFLSGVGVVNLAGTGIRKLPGAASLLQRTLAPVASTAQRIEASGKLGKIGVTVAKKGAEGAAPGLFADYVTVNMDDAFKEATEWANKTDRSLGEEIFGPLLYSDPNDTQQEVRSKAGLIGLGVGAGANNLLYGAGLLARRIVHLYRVRKSAAEAQASGTKPVDPSNPTNPVAEPPKQPGGQVAADLARLRARQPRPFETPGFTEQPKIDLDLDALTDQQAIDMAQALAGVRSAYQGVERELSALSNSVPDEVGKVDFKANPTGKPTYSQIQQVSPAELEIRPQEMQYKIRGQSNKQGLTGTNRIEQWDERLAGLISVARDPSTGRLVVANGHHRAEAALRLGADKVNVMVVSDDLVEGRMIGAIQNIAEGQGTPWDAAKLMRDGRMGASDLAMRNVDLGGRIARDAIPLSRLPQELFDAGVQGKLGLDKAVALGSVDGLDETVIRDVAAAASKGKWSPDKIAQAMQEARFATVERGTGVLPGFEDLMKSSNFADVLAVRTAAYKSLREQMIALTSAAIPGRKGILQAAGNVIDVAGSRAAKDQAAAALKLFNDVAGYVGPVRNLLTQMAERVKGGASVKKVVGENLAALKEAIEAEVNGGKLPLTADTATPVASRQLTEEQERMFIGSAQRVQTLEELDPQRLAAERQQAAETIDRAEEEVAQRISTANQQVSKQAVGDAQRYGLNPRKVQKMMDMDDPAMVAEINGYTKWILSQKQYDSRLAKLRGYDEQYEVVRVFNDEMPGSNSGRELTKEEFDAKYGDQTPVVPKTADVNRVERDLDRHEEAVAVLEWYQDWSARPKSTAPKQPVALTPIDETIAREEAVAFLDKIAETAPPQVRDEVDRLAINAFGGKPTPEQRRSMEQGLGGKTARSATPPASFTFPGDLSKSAPRYGSATIEFASDLDRAAYMLRDVTKKSRGEDRLIAALEAAGYDIPAIRKHGAMVKEQIKTLVKDQTGSAAAPVGKQMALEVPDQGFNRGLSLGSELDSELASMGMSSKEIMEMIYRESIKDQRLRVEAARKIKDRWQAANPRPSTNDPKAFAEYLKNQRPFVDPFAEEYARLLEMIDGNIGTIVPSAFGIQTRTVSREVYQKVSEAIAENVRRMLGPEFAVRFENLPYMAPKGVEWGASGKELQLTMLNGQFDPIEGVVHLYDMLGMAGGQKRKISTGYHEAWHAIQYYFLNEDELRAMNSFYAQILFNKAKREGAKGMLEKQATAFERYAYAKDKGLPVAAYMLGMSETALKGQRVVNGAKVPLSGIEAGAMNAAVQAAKILDNLTSWAEAMHNYFVARRGWTSTRDLFEAAYTGKLAKRGSLGSAIGDQSTDRGRILQTIRTMKGVSQSQGRRLDLFSEGDPPPPPRNNTPEANDGEGSNWTVEFARLAEKYRDAVASGEMTMEDLYKMNAFAKPQSPGGRQYTNQSEDLIPGLAAMSKVSPDRATMTGIKTFNAEEIYAINQRWFDAHGGNGEAVMAGLDQIAGAFREYEQGALNRNLAYADKLMVRAQYEAAAWMQSATDGSINRQAQLARLMLSADSARRMHIAIATLQRRWGQFGLEMQMKRDYRIDMSAAPVSGDKPSNIVDAAIRQELEIPPGANPVTDELTKKFPDLTEALQTGRMTPEAEAIADEIAQTLRVMGESPAMRQRVWRQWDAIPPATADKPENPLNALQILRSSNLLSAGGTASVNLANGLFNMARLTIAQGVGGLLVRDFDRMLYATQMFGGYFKNIGDSLRIASIAFKTGRPMFNMDASTLDFLERQALREAQGELMARSPNARTGYTLNTLDMSEQFAATRTGQFANALWQTLGTFGGRMAVTVDAFNSSLSGHTYEFFRHMPRGMQLAEQAGLEKFSKEAFDYAYKYADARVDQAIKDVVYKGETLADAAMTSPEAKRFMDSVNFTDKIWADLEPRTMGDGFSLGRAQGLKGQELQEFAQKYVDEGRWYHKAADAMLNGPVPLGRLSSLPGEALDTFSNMKVVGPIFRFVQPFQRVPGNIIKSAARNSPAAVFVDTWWRDVTSRDVATRQRALGEWAIGSTAMTALWVATNMGSIRMNGGGPIDPQQRERWMRERGGMSYSFQMWDEETMSWGEPISLKAFEPFTTLFGSMADYSDMAGMMTTEQRNRAGAALVFDLMKVQTAGLLSKTYFQGLNELYEFALDPSKVFTGPNKRSATSRFMQRIIASLVPHSSALREMRRGVDQIQRRVEPSLEGGFGGFWEETWQEIKNALPGMSYDLPPVRDWSAPGTPPVVMPALFGNKDLAENAPWMAGLMQYVPVYSAFKVGQQLADPVQQEMASMHGKGTMFAGPRASDFGSELYLAPSELDQYVQIFGRVKDPAGRTWHQAVDALIRTADYQSLPIDPPSGQFVSHRAALIQTEIARFKQLAKQEFLYTTPKGAEILEAQEVLKGRQNELNYIRQYGVPGASRGNAGGNLELLDLNR